MRLYLDTSALVKLVVAEAESDALSAYLRSHPDDAAFTSALARTELLRAVAAGGVAAVTEARRLLDSLDTVALSRSLLDHAGTLPPTHLRTLDAIHLAAALLAGSDLRAVITYDNRMSEAAAVLGMPAVGPS